MWVGESGAVPSSLVVILRDQGLNVVIAREAPEVMVELAEAGGTCGGAGDGASVVVVEPEGRARADELIQAIAQYHPGVACWRYAVEAGSSVPRLGPYHGSSGAGNNHVIRDDDAAAHDPSVQNAGRVKGAHQRLRSLVVKVDRRASEGPLVSEDELAMLLRPVADHDGGREKGLKGAWNGG